MLLVCGSLLFPDGVDDLVGAIKSGDRAQVESLVEDGLDVDAFDSNNYTPLYYAVESNRLEIAEYLLAHGVNANADYTVTFGPGQSTPPVHVALINGHQAMVDLLLEYGASPTIVRDHYSR